MVRTFLITLIWVLANESDTPMKTPWISLLFYASGFYSYWLITLGLPVQEMASLWVPVRLLFSEFPDPLIASNLETGHHGWLHWFNHPIPQGGRPNTDLWPDVSSYSPSELFSAPGLFTKSGDPVFLFSSRNAKTVQRYVMSSL